MRFPDLFNAPYLSTGVEPGGAGGAGGNGGLGGDGDGPPPQHAR